MSTFYYLTRSYPCHEVTGGSLMREAQVVFFEKHFSNVVVVMPNYQTKKIVRIGNVIQIPFTRMQRLSSILERIGLFDDYLESWVKSAYAYLVNRVTKADILFSTCGGESSSIKLGFLLKQVHKCKHFVNFHDPIDYSYVNGKMVDTSLHVNRDNLEKKYLSNVDFIITSSKLHQKSLVKKYPFLSDIITNVYFGYIDRSNSIPRQKDSVFRIAFSGSMTKLQKPELLLNAFESLNKDIDGIELLFIGNNKDGLVSKNKNVKFLKGMERNMFTAFMNEHVDLGFVSLANEYLGVCVPSKIYEYINIGIPMIGALPAGDAAEIIDQKYGICCSYKDPKCIIESIKTMLDIENYRGFKENIIRDNVSWSLDARFKEIPEILKNLSNDSS
jgi:glycosyltransferase involved in cell wall biosynthesis